MSVLPFVFLKETEKKAGEERQQANEGLWRMNREMANESLKMVRDFLEVIGLAVFVVCGLRFL